MAEMRKAEQELERLKSEWKALRRKRACFDSATAAVDLSVLPAWKYLMTKVVDEDISLVIHVEEPVEDLAHDRVPDLQSKDKCIDSTATEINDEDTTNAPEEEAGYSEWGMLITGAIVAKDIEVKSAEQPGEASLTKVGDATTDEDEASIEEDASVVNASPTEVLSQLRSMSESVEILRPKIEKFISRLTEKDPITKKPRYGEKALARVKKIIRIYKGIDIGASIVNETGFMKDIEAQISQHKEQLEAKAKAIQATKQSEAERVEQELRLAEQLAEEQRLKEEAAKRKEIEELAQRAQEARLRRLEEEQRAIDEEAEADKALLALVPVKGADGVRSQIDRMRTALKDDKKALDIALGSLYTLFDQIVRKPEEVNFRSIRRDHPKFMEDIGRHVGGQEVLIAAGFRLEKLDGVPCFFSKEPHIESDMDGWSDWFDGMKKYLEIVEDEMIK
ncbi:hypothetical protein ACHAXN_009026 [Cyclotella atomus]